MKRGSKTLFGIIILLTVLFCTGTDASSNSNIPTTIVEHPAVDNCWENNSSTNVDFFDDEQINQFSDSFSAAHVVFQIHIPQNCILISRFPSLIWQPPKNK